MRNGPGICSSLVPFNMTALGNSWMISAAESDMASNANARKFTAGVCKASVRGTPSRPGRMDVYLFELYDESRKEGACHEKHFGLFDQEGCQKQ